MYIMSRLAYCVCITCSSQDQNSRWIQTEAPYAQEPLYTLHLLSQTHTRHSTFLARWKQDNPGKKNASFKSSKTKISNFLKFQKMMFTVFSGKRREDREIKRRRKPESRNSSDAPGFSSSCIRILFFSFFCCFSVSLRFGSFSFGSLMERVIITQRVETK